jgi:general secretion pathway protein G
MLARPIRPSSLRVTPAARRGFTLLEVLVVVTILVILASLATFAATTYLKNAKLSECDLKMQKVEAAVKNYHVMSGGAYPQSLSELTVAGEAGVLLEGGNAAITDPWGQPFQFTVTQDSSGAERVVISTVTPDGQQRTWPRN